MNTKTRMRIFYPLPSLKITSGTLEAMKWLAMLAMTIDHINRIFWNTSSYTALSIGRLAMPLFAFIFAYNLARPEALAHGTYGRAFKRLILFGLLATPAYMAMRYLQHIYPFNIMFSFFIAALCMFLYEKGGVDNIILAVFLFFIGGVFVEYNWQGIAFCLSCWFYCKKPSLTALIASVFFCVFIARFNGNNWALASFPIIFLATKLDLTFPRIPYFFYAYYPLHLTVLVLLSKYLGYR